MRAVLGLRMADAPSVSTCAAAALRLLGTVWGGAQHTDGHLSAVHLAQEMHQDVHALGRAERPLKNPPQPASGP